MNATNGRAPAQHVVDGVVEATNATGLKLGGAWINVSRYKPVELPEVGAHVHVQVDDRGYIKSLEVVDRIPSIRSDNSTNIGSDTRNRTISKLTVLKAAAHFGASRDITSAQVLQVADLWLKWVEREP